MSIIWRKRLANYLSTIIGAGVALAEAWVSIDWENFEWNAGTVMKLALSAFIALGGYMTSINLLNKPAK